MAKSKTNGDKYEVASIELMKRIQHDLGIKDVERGAGRAVIGQCGTPWNPDQLAFTSDGTMIIVECRYRGPRTGGVKQNDMAAFAYILDDTGAEGIVITTKPIQKGAKMVAKNEIIGIIEFQPGDTFDDFVARTANFLRNHLFLGTSDSLDFSDDCCIELEYKDGSFAISQPSTLIRERPARCHHEAGRRRLHCHLGGRRRNAAGCSY